MQVARWLLAFLFIVAGSLHFLRPASYLAIMPPWLPAPRVLVYFSGLCEICGGLGLLPRATRPTAAWGLITLLIAIFPANLHMAFNPQLFPRVPHWALWARLPLQLPLIAWASLYTRTP